MSKVHFLNVGNGDCSIIQHNSDRITMIDICKGKELKELADSLNISESVLIEKAIKGNFNMKDKPENPILYLKKLRANYIHRFILTHPDMDHLDGFKYLKEQYVIFNFWDTDNNEEKEFGTYSNYNEEDWEEYINLKSRDLNEDPKRLLLYAGADGKYFNRDEENKSGGDGLYVLSPTKELIDGANKCGDYNDCSYVLLYKSGGYKILFVGDSHDKTWEHLMQNHKSDIKDIDVLMAPHHGRDSERDHSFLDIVKPKITLFGNAPYEHLSKDWARKGLEVIRNNQAGNIVLEILSNALHISVSNEVFARKYNENTFLDADTDAWYLKAI